MTTPLGERDRQLHQPTAATLRQLALVVDRPAPPDVMARRARALFEIAASMQPPPRNPLWTVLGVRRPATEGDFMSFLRMLAKRSGLSYNDISSRTQCDTSIESVPRSTTFEVLKRDQLPRREDQLRALLVVLVDANGGNRDDVDNLLTLRAELVAARARAVHAAPGHHVEPVTSECARCQRWRSPLALAGAVSAVVGTVALSIVVVATILHLFI